MLAAGNSIHWVLPALSLVVSGVAVAQEDDRLERVRDDRVELVLDLSRVAHQYSLILQKSRISLNEAGLTAQRYCQVNRIASAPTLNESKR